VDEPLGALIYTAEPTLKKRNQDGGALVPKKFRQLCRVERIN